MQTPVMLDPTCFKTAGRFAMPVLALGAFLQQQLQRSIQKE